MLIGSRYLNARDYDSVAVRAVGDAIAARYRGRPHTYGAKYPAWQRMHVTREWEYPYVVFASDVQFGDHVLDLGCGGSPLPLFLSEHCSVIGLDSNDVTKGECSLRAYGFNPDPVRVIQADMTASLPFRDEVFDVVTCISTLESVPQLPPMKALGEVARVLRLGGRFVVTIDVDREGTDARHIADWLDVLFFGYGDTVGLWPCGPIDLRKPDLATLPCTYHVFGAVLEKA